MTTASLNRRDLPALSDRQVYRLLFAITVPVFLVSAVVRRAVHAVQGRAVPSRSLFAEARHTASDSLHLAFMG